DGHRLGRPGKYDLIRIGAEDEIAAQEPGELEIFPFAAMNEPDAAWQQVLTGQLPAQANQIGNQSFDLMSVRPSLDANIGKVRCELCSLTKAQGNPFIDHGAVARSPSKSVAQQLRGIQDIIEQTGLAKITVAGKTKTE